MDPGDSELNIEECTQNFNLIFEVFVHGFVLIPKWLSSAFPKKFQSQWFPRLFYMKYLKNINYYKQKLIPLVDSPWKLPFYPENNSVSTIL